MKVYKHSDMNRGWFVGDFESAVFRSKDCEVALQKYKEGDSEPKHVHKVATELTLIASGKVLMNGIEYGEGDIVVMEPGDATDFKALTDVTNVVVKLPSLPSDKYLV